MPSCDADDLRNAFIDLFDQVTASGYLGPLYRISLVVTANSFGVTAAKGTLTGVVWPFASVCYCVLPASLYLDPDLWIYVTDRSPTAAQNVGVPVQYSVSALYEGDFNTAMSAVSSDAVQVYSDSTRTAQDTLAWKHVTLTTDPYEAYVNVAVTDANEALVGYFRTVSGSADVDNLSNQVFGATTTTLPYTDMFDQAAVYFVGDQANQDNDFNDSSISF